MSRPNSAASISGANDALGSAARDWEAVRAAADIQYAPLPAPAPPQTPDWLKHLGEWLEAIFGPLGRLLGMSWPVFGKVLIALAILAVAALVWQLVRSLLARRASRQPAAEPEWAPDRDAALALLEDADRLAAEGKFAEATHLLLRRSVGQIAAARPDWLHPASTAREIAALPDLPARARGAFAVIAARVERSLFALRSLGPDDWQAARAAYAEFALADLPGARAPA